MKQITYTILAFSAFVSCQTNKTEKIEGTKIEKADTTQQVTEQADSTNNIKGNSIFIKDSSDYSISFLNAVTESGIQNIALVGNLFILEQTDTVMFPQIPKIGEKTTLTAKKDQVAIALKIERINQTTIDYEIEMVEFGNASYNYRGQADLSPHFYFGAETDESSLSGTSYLSTEFSDHQDSCYTYIRLGVETESGPYLLGKIKKNCNGKIENIGLENFPTLVEK